MNINSLAIKTFKRVITFFVISFPLYIGISFAQPPTQDICLVTVDSTSTKNIIVWEKPATNDIDSFKIYRDIVGTYVHIGNVPYNSLSIFIDSTNGVNPQISSYKYKLSVVDSFGIESILSAYHKTISLMVMQIIPPSIDLIWDNYQGFPVSYFRILRDSSGTGNFQAIVSVPSVINSWTDVSPPTCSNVYYQIEATHPTGCTATAKAKNFNSTISNTVSVIISPCTYSLSFNNVDALCNGACDGTATVTPMGGISPYTYAWNNGQIDSIATGLCAGTYSVAVTDANNINITDSVTITEPLALVLTVVTSGATCGNADGSAIVIVNGGTVPYTYSWSSGDTLANADSLFAGIYIITVTDANGCSNNTTANISDINGAIIFVNTVADVTCNGDSNGAINITTIGGTPPYTYDWSNGDTTEDISDIPGDIYNLIITDNAGCISIMSIAVNEPDVLNMSIITTDANCGDAAGSATVNVTGGKSPYNYLWETGSTGATEDSLAAGVYNITVTDANTCSITDSVTIFEPSPGPQTNAIIGASNVNENTLENYAVTLYSGSIYGWSVIGGTQFSGGQTNAISVLWGSIGVGTLSIIETDTVGCTGDTVSLTVNIGSSGINQFQVSSIGFRIYPNPYTDNTQISYTLNTKANVSLIVYSLLGLKVQTLVNNEQVSGKYQYSFSAQDLAYSKGIYVLKLIIDNVIYIKQLVEF